MANEVSAYTHEGMELPFEDWSKTLHSSNDLASIIQSTHDAAQSSAINRMQTMRNWLIGYYIVVFEQHGKEWYKDMAEVWLEIAEVEFKDGRIVTSGESFTWNGEAEDPRP